jgi:hypothetical protein
LWNFYELKPGLLTDTITGTGTGDTNTNTDEC